MEGGEWELRGHKTSVTNNSRTDVFVTAKEMMKVFPGCHTIRSSTKSYSLYLKLHISSFSKYIKLIKRPNMHMDR